jgi:hypothetical protein
MFGRNNKIKKKVVKENEKEKKKYSKENGASGHRSGTCIVEIGPASDGLAA